MIHFTAATIVASATDFQKHAVNLNPNFTIIFMHFQSVFAIATATATRHSNY
jgi:hypothetical protein